MDYGRIYRELIADRRANPPGDDEYTETHHVLPRCLGGDDDVENLIRLRPEDHFFAHLLLARIHDTHGLWAAVAAMGGRSRVRLRGRQERVGYGIARRAVAVHLSRRVAGTGHPLYDDEVRLFVHADGLRSFQGTRYEFRSKYSLSRRPIDRMVKGELRSAYGWRLAETPLSSVGPKRGDSNHNADVAPRELWSVDGRRFVGTRAAAVETTGLTRKEVGRLVNGRTIVCRGWYLPSNAERVQTLFSKHGPKSKGVVRRPRDPTIYQFVHADKRTFSGTIHALAEMIEVPSSRVATAVRRGGLCAGWHLASVPYAKVKRLGAQNPNYSHVVYEFVHDGGERFSGTRHAFCTNYDLDAPTVIGVVKGRRRSAFGWRLAPSAPAADAV